MFLCRLCARFKREPKQMQQAMRSEKDNCPAVDYWENCSAILHMHHLGFPTKKKTKANALVFSSVGARGFEPPTSPTRTVRASRAAPRPEHTLRHIVSAGTYVPVGLAHGLYLTRPSFASTHPPNWPKFHPGNYRLHICQITAMAGYGEAASGSKVSFRSGVAGASRSLPKTCRSILPDCCQPNSH